MKHILPICLTTVFFVLFVETGVARQWNSRGGGFSVEADLVDVRDGNVVLKKADGSQITVPLNKLSLEDIRYIERALKVAEERVNGKMGESASPSADNPSRDADKDGKANAKYPGGSKDSKQFNGKRDKSQSDGADWGSSRDEQDAEDSQQDAGDKSDNGSSWGGQSVALLDSNDDLCFGPPTCPTMIAGRHVWDIKTNRNTAALRGKEPRGSGGILSPDGHWHASAKTGSTKTGHSKTTVSVWNTRSGKCCLTLPEDYEGSTPLLALSNERLYVSSKNDNSLEVWDIAGGQKEKTLKVPVNGIRNKSACMSVDGKYLATVAHDRMVVLSLGSGAVVATMASPRQWEDRDDLPLTPPSPNGNRRYRNHMTLNEAIFVYAWTPMTAFSPDGQELAAISTHPNLHLMCWNNRGQLVFDERYRSGRGSIAYETLEWFPNRQAWLLCDGVLDRETCRYVVTFGEPKFGSKRIVHVVDDDHVIGLFPNNPSQLETQTIPWKDIRASLAALKKKEPALLTPEEPVGVQIDLRNLRGDQNETSKILGDALNNRLKQDGFRLEADSSTFFRLKFTEKAGDRIPIYERQSPFDRQGRDTGQTAVESHGSLVVELVVPGRAEPIWRETLAASSSRSFSEQINDATVRKSMLSALSTQIERLAFPYYVPKLEKLLALPVVIGR